MAALSAAKLTPIQGSFRKKTYPVKASSTIYKGGLVALDTASGYVVAASDAASRKVVGIAEETADNSSGSSGDINVTVICDCIARLAAASIAITSHGALMYVVDDATVDEATGTNSVKVGILVEYVSATEGLVYIPAAPGLV